MNLLVDNFPCFRDETRFEGKPVRFYKRAQILVADLWACFEGTSHGQFHDIDTITMFAGKRVDSYYTQPGLMVARLPDTADAEYSGLSAV